MTDEAPELHREPEAALEMAANAVITYMHEADIVGEKQKRSWLQRLFDRIVAKELSH